MKKKKSNTPRQISVFIASPGDLAPERKIFKDAIEALNAGFAEGAGVHFTPLGWEDLLAETGRRVQTVINRQIEQCDLFVLVLNRQWGREAPDSKATSYTEEEFRLAFKLWKKTGSPRILIFFKQVDAASLADPGVQLQKVQAFRKEMEAGHIALMRRFNTEVDFGREIDRHLREYIKGGWDELNQSPSPIKFSKGTLKSLKQAKELTAPQRQAKKTAAKSTADARRQTKVDLTLVKMNQKDLALARAAVRAAESGNMEDASILFAQATESTTQLSILSVASEFFQKVGDYDNATRLKQRQVALAHDVSIAANFYMDLVPDDVLAKGLEYGKGLALANVAPDLVGPVRALLDEALTLEAIKRMTVETIVNHYTESEIVELSRFTARPIGQSFLQKNEAIQREMGERSQQEVLQLIQRREAEQAPLQQSDPVAALPQAT